MNASVTCCRTFSSSGTAISTPKTFLLSTSSMTKVSMILPDWKTEFHILLLMKFKLTLSFSSLKTGSFKMYDPSVGYCEK